MSLTPPELGSEPSSTEGAIATAPTARPVNSGLVRVNLIPAEIAEARALRTTTGVAAAAALVVVAGVLVLWHGQTSKQDDAKSRLAAAQTENTRLQQEQTRLGSVDGLYAKVDAATSMYQTVAAPQILWSRYLEDLRLQLPDHVWLTNFSTTEAAPSAAAASTTAKPSGARQVPTAAGGTATTPASTAIGTLSIAGSSYTHKDVADLLDKLAALRGVNTAFVSSSTEALIGKGAAAVPTVNFNASATLTSDALRSAYDGTPQP